MKLREIVRKVREGPIISDQPLTRTRIPPPQNDVRPGLPTPNPRIDTLPNIAQGKTPTYAPVTNPQQLSPDSRWSQPGRVRIQKGPAGREYPVGGASPTQTGGYGKNTASGTGLQDQRMVGVRPAAPGRGTRGTSISGQKERRRRAPQ